MVGKFTMVSQLKRKMCRPRGTQGLEYPGAEEVKAGKRELSKVPRWRKKMWIKNYLWALVSTLDTQPIPPRLQSYGMNDDKST